MSNAGGMAEGGGGDGGNRPAAMLARLAGLHAEVAGLAPEVRRTRLAALIERDAGSLSPAERSASLEELGVMLGDVRAALGSAAGTGGGGEDGASDLSKVDDVPALVARLIELAPTMAESQRSVAKWQLRDAGLGGEAAGGAAAGAGERGRSPEVQAALAEFAASLDQLVWSTWRTIAPESDLRRPAPIKGSLKRVMDGEGGEEASAVVRGDIERLRQLTAALIAAIGQAGRQFAQRHSERFAPVELERAARDEGARSIEGRAWEKYRQLAAGEDADTVQRDMMAAIAGYVETVMRSAGAAGARGSAGGGGGGRG